MFFEMPMPVSTNLDHDAASLDMPRTATRPSTVCTSPRCRPGVSTATVLPHPPTRSRRSAAVGKQRHVFRLGHRVMLGHAGLDRLADGAGTSSTASWADRCVRDLSRSRIAVQPLGLLVDALEELR